MTPINVPDKDKTLLVRQIFMLAFFAQGSFSEMADGALQAFESWAMVVQRQDINWSYLGASASSHKEVNARSWAQCRSMLDRNKAAARKMTAFEMLGPEKYNPAFRFTVVGDQNPNLEKGVSNLVQVVFPMEIIDTMGTEALVEFSLKVAAALPYDSGYLSPALNWNKDSRRAAAGAAMLGPAMRHPGLDISMNSATRLRIGALSRGARWLTFLGPRLIRGLGGRETVSGNLHPEVHILRAGAGLALRSSQAPAVGDVNREDNLPSLRSVARAIEPVTFFGDRLLQSALFMENPGAIDRWERRLLS